MKLEENREHSVDAEATLLYLRLRNDDETHIDAL